MSFIYIDVCEPTGLYKKCRYIYRPVREELNIRQYFYVLMVKFNLLLTAYMCTCLDVYRCGCVRVDLNLVVFVLVLTQQCPVKDNFSAWCTKKLLVNRVYLSRVFSDMKTCRQLSCSWMVNCACHHRILINAGILRAGLYTW